MWAWFPAVAHLNIKKQTSKTDNIISPNDEIESIKTAEKESTGVLDKTPFETSKQGK